MRSLYVTAAVVMAGVSSVFALLAELEDRYGLTTRSLGLISGSAFLTALVTQLSLARYADRGYAALLLRGGVAVSAIGLLWFGFATELWQFVAARALLGIGGGMLIPPARRAIVLTSDGNQGERLGTFYGAYLAGFVFGPPVAGLLTELGDVRLPFFVFGGLVLLTLFSVVRVDIPEEDRNVVITGTDKRVIRRLVADRRVVAALLVIVSFRYSIGVFEPLWATHLDDLGASTTVIGLSLTGFALPMLIVAKPAGRLSDRFGSRRASLLPALMTAPLMMTYGYSPFIWLILLVALPHGLLEAILSPASQAAIADASAEKDTGAAQGLGEAAGSGAAAIGAFSAPVAFDAWGPGPAWLMAGIAMVVLVTVSWLLDPPTRRRRNLGPAASQAVDATDAAKIGSR